MAVVLFLLGNIYVSNITDERNSILKQKLSLTADKIEDVIESRLFMLDELESHVRVSPQIDQSHFEILAQTMLKRDPSLRSLQLARNSVISHIYPLTNNEAALGHDLLGDIKRKSDVLLAYQSNTATIAGPLNLRQGGSALIVRQPINIKNPVNQVTKIWGLSILILDWDELLQETDLLSLGDEQIGIRKRVANIWQPAFWGNNDLFSDSEKAVVMVDIRLPNSVWQLAMKTDTKSSTFLSYIVLIVCIIIVLLIYFFRQAIHKLTWTGPIALAGAFVLLSAVITGLSYYSINNQHRQELLEQAEIIRVDIRNRLKDSLDYIQLLTLARTSDNLTEVEFQHRVSDYVSTHPELINITWIDEQFIIRNVAPLAGNQQIIGLEIDLKEPRRASRLAKELRLPVYTHPFVAIQGPSAFEVWVPVYRGNKFMGLFAGVYSVPSLFKTVLTDEKLQHFGISMITHDGKMVDRTLLNDTKEVHLTQTVALSPPGYDIALRLDRYQSQVWRWDTIILALLAFSLAISVFWGMFILLRARTELQQRYHQLSEAQDALHREKEFFQVTLLSIGDGVITMDINGKINNLNPVAETITQWPSNKAEGKLLYEVLPLLDITDQHSMKQTLLNCINEAMSGHSCSTMGLLLSEQQYSLRCTLTPIKNKRGEAIGSVLILHDITEMHLMTQELEHRAKHDSLTGLVNRMEFEERLQHAVSIARTDNCQHSLLYIDLDQFKVVNDTCGHLAGDELLMQLTSLLQEKIRASDTLARLGGDEFGVLLMNCALPQAVNTAEILRQQVDEFRFLWNDKSFSLGLSIGLVVIDKNTENHSHILSTADVACYMAKEGGRNRVHVYTEDDEETSRRHGEMHWVARITAALEKDSFVLYRQTILPLCKSQPGAHYELLLRLQEDDGTIISPGAFLPAAERYDMMIQIDRWVFNSALKFFQQNPNELEELLLCSMNISAQSLSNEEFLVFLKNTLEVNPHWCNKLCFEITETSAIRNILQAKRFISNLKALGCRFALDDFGSGMSSFGYLKNLPVDFLKIDGSFVKDCAQDPIDLAMVKSVNDVGHVMKMETIAEWVEDKQTLNALKTLGVDYVQGYAVDKPQPLFK
jgi:diguanylate cyclase (GGDEF)-like protein